ncbi:hypothetical protein D3C80_1084670 [compost metagenome]
MPGYRPLEFVPGRNSRFNLEPGAHPQIFNGKIVQRIGHGNHQLAALFHKRQYLIALSHTFRNNLCDCRINLIFK